MVAISNGRGIAIVDYELEVAAAGVLRRRLRVRLRFGFVVAASLLSTSLLPDAGFAGVVFAVLATAFADGLARPWSICNTPDSIVGDSAFFETLTSPAGCGWVCCACWRAARSAARCSGVFGGV